MVKNISLIGLGGIGFRHLQALLNLNKDFFNIYLVDIDQQRVELAEKESHAAGWESSKNIFINNDLSELPDENSICLIATTSLPRLNILKQLVNKTNTEKIIFEKVLFTNSNECREAAKILKNTKIKAWVNCPRRAWSGYKTLQANIIDNYLPINATYQEKDWGLACNAIHFLDLFVYLTGSKADKIQIDLRNIEKKLYPSKRDGYYEIYGTLNAKIDNFFELSLTHLHEKPDEANINIQSAQGTIKIFESDDKIQIADQSFCLEQKYQSQLTNKFVEDLVETQSCDLPTFEESNALHTIFLDALEHFQKSNQLEVPGGKPWIIT